MGQVQHLPARTPQYALEQGPIPLEEHEGPTEACALGGEHDGWRLADHTPHVVLDTNVFVGAGFNPRSHSALLLDAVRDGRLRMIWDDATHEEIEHVLRRIPHLSWEAVAELFREEDRFDGATHPDQFGYVPDPTDRKFAALADAANVPLVTSDRGLLNARGQAPFPILKPGEFVLDQ
jgi:predicted nucleic acid-binding protein